MWDGDGAADNQGHIEGVDDLGAVPARLGALDDVVGDAVVATEHSGGDQAQQFLGLGVECAGFVGLVVEGKEAFDAEVTAVEDFFIEIRAEVLETV